MRRYAYFSFVLLCLLALSSCSEHKHVFKSTAVAPSCTYGYTLHTCDGCGYSYTDGYRDALGHDYEITVESTDCRIPATINYRCKSCSHEYVEHSDSLAVHSYEAFKVAPTKSTGGYIDYTCTRCGHSYTEETSSPLGYSAGLEYEEIRSGVVRLVGLGDCTDADVVVPRRNEYNELVEEISGGAFDGAGIKSLTVSRGIKSIRAGAVKECNSLVEITVAVGVDIEKNAFVRLSAVERLSMPISMELCYVFAGRVPDTLGHVTALGDMPCTAIAGVDSIEVLAIAGGEYDMEYDFSGCTSLMIVTKNGKIIYSGNKENTK